MKIILFLLLLCSIAYAHEIDDGEGGTYYLPPEPIDATSVVYQPTGVWCIMTSDGKHTHYVDGTQVSQEVYDAAKAQKFEDLKDFELTLPKEQKAVLLTLFDLINATRASAGLPEIPKETFKQYAKEKYETL